MFSKLFVMVFAIHCVFGALLNAQEADTFILSLADCEKLALENNLKVQNARYSIKIAEARKIQAAHLGILPKLELKHTWGPVSRARAEFNEFGVLMSPDTSFRLNDLRYFSETEFNLLQPLYTFGKLQNAKNAAEYGYLAEKANLEKVDDDVQFQIRELYWTVLLEKELLIVIEDAKKEIDKAETKIENKLDEGSDEVSQTDLFKLQIFRYEIVKRLSNTNNEIQITEAILKSAIGLNDTATFVLMDKFLEPVDVQLSDLPTYLDMAYKHRPEVRQLQAGLKARQALVNVAKSDYYPQIYFGGQVKYNYARDRFDSKNPFVYNPTNFFRPGFVVGFNMNLNFMQIRDKVRVEQAEYNKLAQKDGLLSDGMKIEVQKTLLEVKQAEMNIMDSRKALKASENWLRSVSMTFDIGVGDVKELIDAYKANGQMQSEHLQNIYKFNVAVARLSQVVGRDLYVN